MLRQSYVLPTRPLKLHMYQYPRFFHHLVNDRRKMRLLNGSPVAGTLFGLMSLSLSSLATAVGPKTCQQDAHSHDRYAPEIEELYHGNQAFVGNMSKTNPGLLQGLADDGQKPPFMVVDCSDSRVNEQGIFSAGPGTMFTAGNIANQFDEADPSSNAVLAYAVEALNVKHVIVMGHYGCGGVSAAMVPPAEPKGLTPQSAALAVQKWISPIRQLYQTSNRSEIVAHRKKQKRAPSDDSTPHLSDPAFRALVEENVKANVLRIAKSAIIQEHYGSVALRRVTTSNSENITEVYIHGWVYDVENGEVFDVGVSMGPSGKKIPPSPFPIIKAS